LEGRCSWEEKEKLPRLVAEFAGEEGDVNFEREAARLVELLRIGGEAGI
jgi:hypothetical protein